MMLSSSNENFTRFEGNGQGVHGSNGVEKLKMIKVPVTSITNENGNNLPNLVPLREAVNGCDGTQQVAHGSNAEDSPKKIVESFYMRALPWTSIALSSQEGQRKLDEARANGMAEGFFDIISYIEPQKELAYCGIASLVTVLNTLRVDPCKPWKGCFRWYDETMLTDQETLRRVMTEGVTLEELVAFVPRDKVECHAQFACDTTLDKFRQRVRDVCSSPSRYLICTYSRSLLNQTGDGHYSPIVAYHDATDSILVLDVARYKYPPHWVSCSLMWDAMNTIDEVSKKSRGFILLSAAAQEKN